LFDLREQREIQAKQWLSEYDVCSHACGWRLRKGLQMLVRDVIVKIVSFLRVGHPQGVPAADGIPLMALLRRRLSDAEVVQIATSLGRHANLALDATNIRVMVTKITDQLPSPEEVERVKERLEIRGCTVSDEFPPARGR
jgi:hypothetical protein